MELLEYHADYLNKLKRKPDESFADWDKRAHDLTCDLYRQAAELTWDTITRCISRGEYHAARQWMKTWIKQTEEAERPFVPEKEL